MGEGFSTSTLLILTVFRLRRLGRSRAFWLALAMATVFGGVAVRFLPYPGLVRVFVAALALAPALALASQSIGDSRTGLADALHASPAPRGGMALSGAAGWAVVFVAECVVFKLITAI